MTVRQLASIRQHLAAIYAVIDEVRTEQVADKAVSGRKLGDRIKFICRFRGLSQATLANRIGMAPAQLNRIVTGRTDPSIGTIRTIAKGLGVPLTKLIAD